MTVSKADVFYGIHSFMALDRTTKKPYASSSGEGRSLLRVLKSAQLNSGQELVELTGGSYTGAVAVERGKADISVQIKFSEYPSWLYKLAGYVVSFSAAELSGAVSTPSNLKGTSVKNNTTGVASASITTAADIKTGRYFVVAASSTTVDVYCDTDIDFQGNGTELNYADDAGKITASALTITASTPVAIPGTGISLTGGSGTIGLTTGDVAVFEVRQPNAGSRIITMPANPTPVEFEGVFYGQKMTGGAVMRLRAFRCLISSFNVPFNEKQFSESDITIKILIDTATNSFFSIEGVIGS